MRRELAAVIACIQQFEVACDALEMLGKSESRFFLQELRQKLRAFFRTPSVPIAHEIAGLVRVDHPLLKENPSEGIYYLEAPVDVDGFKTSLMTLTEELKEVLEDFPGGA